ncbi:MAG: dTMP kinase [Ktedonobacterales bacterium]
MFITFEGGEGAGKTTQAQLLADHLRAAGYTTRLTREPGGTPLASAVRAISLHPDESLHALASVGLLSKELLIANQPTEPILPLTEALLLSAARAQHVAHIRDWLAGGDTVICDRFADATIAYQGYGRGYDVDALRLLERLATGGLNPDLTILLDIPATEGLRRKLLARAKGGEWNRLDKEEVAFHERVRVGYLSLAQKEQGRWSAIDATLPTNVMMELIWKTVSALLLN